MRIQEQFAQKDALLFKEVAAAMNGGGDFTVIYENSKKYIYKIINDVVRNQDTTEELMQETYIQIYTKINTLQDATSFHAWAGRIATNLSLRHIQKYRHEELTDYEEETDGAMIMDKASLDNEQIIPENVLMDREKQRLMGEILDGLPVDQKLAIQYYYYEEMSVKDIAEAMDCSEGTIKSRLNYARKAIKKAVEYLDDHKGTRLYCLGATPFLFLIVRGLAEELSITTTAGAFTASMVASKAVSSAASTAASASASTAASAAGAQMTGAASAASVLGGYSVGSGLLKGGAAIALSAVLAATSMVANSASAAMVAQPIMERAQQTATIAALQAQGLTFDLTGINQGYYFNPDAFMDEFSDFMSGITITSSSNGEPYYYVDLKLNDPAFNQCISDGLTNYLQEVQITQDYSDADITAYFDDLSVVLYTYEDGCALVSQPIGHVEWPQTNSYVLSLELNVQFYTADEMQTILQGNYIEHYIDGLGYMSEWN